MYLHVYLLVLYTLTFSKHYYNSALQKLPVLVWIFGGGYTTGSASLELYNPKKLVQLGNVIFVSMQYRVGSHGFLYMGKDSGAPGNVGMLDQVITEKSC